MHIIILIIAKGYIKKYRHFCLLDILMDIYSLFNLRKSYKYPLKVGKNAYSVQIGTIFVKYNTFFATLFLISANPIGSLYVCVPFLYLNHPSLQMISV